MTMPSLMQLPLMKLASLIFLVLCFLASPVWCLDGESVPLKKNRASSDQSPPAVIMPHQTSLLGLNETRGVGGEQEVSLTKRLGNKAAKPIPGSGSDLLRRPRPPTRNGSPTVAAHHFLPMSSALVQVMYPFLVGFFLFF